MFSSLRVRKVVRLVATSATAGTAMALLFLGGPADAATMITLGRGYM
jgi:hypothetical protein